MSVDQESKTPWVPEAIRLIVNPAAGRGAGRKVVETLQAAGREMGLELAPEITQYPGHAMELASNAAEEGAKFVVVVGGDGTVGEVVNKLVHTKSILGIIPVGTGNDIARSLGLPRNEIRECLEIIRSGKVRKIDVAYAGGRYFLSVMGVGFPVSVAWEANKIRGLKGSNVFFVAMYKSLLRMKSEYLKIRLDDRYIEGEFAALIVQNTPYTGGGLLIAPSAELDDGLLDVITVDKIHKVDLMLNLPRLYHGKHLRHPKFTLTKCGELDIESEQELPTMFDGDIYGSTPVKVGVKRRALKVMVGW